MHHAQNAGIAQGVMHHDWPRMPSPVDPRTRLLSLLTNDDAARPLSYLYHSSATADERTTATTVSLSTTTYLASVSLSPLHYTLPSLDILLHDRFVF